MQLTRQVVPEDRGHKAGCPREQQGNDNRHLERRMNISGLELSPLQRGK